MQAYCSYDLPVSRVARCPVFDRTVRFFGDLSGQKYDAKPDNLENCTKFGQFILSKIIKIVATICQISRLKCSKFDFGWGAAQTLLGSLQLDLRGLLLMEGERGGKGRPTSKGREGKGEGGEEGTEGNGGGGGERKGGQGCGGEKKGVRFFFSADLATLPVSHTFSA